MSSKTAILLSILSIGLCHDLVLKAPGLIPRQHLIFNQRFVYNPMDAFFAAANKKVDVQTNGDDVICEIVVEDHREDKAGYARILSGGIGQKHVAIELIGPGVLKGMDFKVLVYASDSFYGGGQYRPGFADSGYAYDRSGKVYI